MNSTDDNPLVRKAGYLGRFLGLADIIRANRNDALVVDVAIKHIIRCADEYEREEEAINHEPHRFVDGLRS